MGGETLAIDPDQLERARFAMEEYKVLHAEILQRDTVLNQIIAACLAAVVAVIGVALGGHMGVKLSMGLSLAAVAIGLVAWRLVDNDVRNAARRIIEIEEYVNKCVGGDDRMPLSWERRFGLLSRGYVDRLKNFDYDAQA